MRIIRVRDVMAKTGLGRCTIYKHIHKESFPKPISLGKRAIGWIESEVDEWILERVKNRDEAAANLAAKQR